MTNTLPKTTAREFCNEDYYGFADAQSWHTAHTNSLPLVRNFSEEVLGVADANGIMICFDDEDGNFTNYCWYVEFPSQSVARILLDGIKQNVQRNDLIAAGFTAELV